MKKPTRPRGSRHSTSPCVDAFAPETTHASSRPGRRTGPLLLAATVSLIAPTRADTTIFTDTFDAAVGSWFKGVPSVGDSLTVTADPLPIGQLEWKENGNSMAETIARPFAETTLAIGQKLRVSFDYRQNGITTNNIIRAGLYNVTTTVAADNWAGGNALGAWAGYTSFVRDASGTGNIARVESGTTTSGTVGPTQGATGTFTTITSPANTTNFNLNDDGTVTYQVVFEVNYVSATQMDTLFTISSTAGETTTAHFTVTGTTSTIHPTFDTFVLKQAGTTAMPVYYDNIKLELIGNTAAPDPAIFADWQEITWPGNTDANTIGPAADPDGDGIINRLEWALHLDATEPDVFAPTFVKNGAVLDFTYVRRKTAPGEATFQVEWSDTLANDWSTAGVTEDAPASIDTTSESLHATIPAGANGRRFVRVRVSD